MSLPVHRNDRVGPLVILLAALVALGAVASVLIPMVARLLDGTAPL